MTEFKPDQRQQRLIEQAMRSHRDAQTRGQYAPDRLVEKWSSELGIKPEKKRANAGEKGSSAGPRAQDSKHK